VGALLQGVDKAMVSEDLNKLGVKSFRNLDTTFKYILQASIEIAEIKLGTNIGLLHRLLR
jgi:hypothetical protein